MCRSCMGDGFYFLVFILFCFQECFCGSDVVFFEVEFVCVQLFSLFSIQPFENIVFIEIVNFILHANLLHECFNFLVFFQFSVAVIDIDVSFIVDRTPVTDVIKVGGEIKMI